MSAQSSRQIENKLHNLKPVICGFVIFSVIFKVFLAITFDTVKIFELLSSKYPQTSVNNLSANVCSKLLVVEHTLFVLLWIC